MGRSRKRAAAGREKANAAEPDYPAADAAARPRPARAVRNKWFLVLAVAMQAVWIGLLAAMALVG
jgi:hypothetical protein